MRLCRWMWWVFQSSDTRRSSLRIIGMKQNFRHFLVRWSSHSSTIRLLSHEIWTTRFRYADSQNFCPPVNFPFHWPKSSTSCRRKNCWRLLIIVFSVPQLQRIRLGTPSAITLGFLFVELTSTQRVLREKPSTAPWIKIPNEERLSHPSTCHKKLGPEVPYLLLFRARFLRRSTPSGSMTAEGSNHSISSHFQILRLSRLVNWRYPVKDPREFSSSSRIAPTMCSVWEIDRNAQFVLALSA